MVNKAKELNQVDSLANVVQPLDLTSLYIPAEISTYNNSTLTTAYLKYAFTAVSTNCDRVSNSLQNISNE